MATYQNLFVAKLPRTVTDTDLEGLFKDYSPRSAKIMLDPTTGKSKGFGFVLFNSAEEGQAAFQALSGSRQSIHDQHFRFIMQPSSHNGSNACAESNALYVRNIPTTTSKAEVQKMLSSFGSLCTCSIRPDHNGSPVWVVFVEFISVECAKNALLALHNNSTYFADMPPILAKFAETESVKIERRKRREQQQAHETDVPAALPLLHLHCECPLPVAVAHARSATPDGQSSSAGDQSSSSASSSSYRSTAEEPPKQRYYNNPYITPARTFLLSPQNRCETM